MSRVRLGAGGSAVSEWEINGPNREDAIESAINTALSMRLLGTVIIGRSYINREWRVNVSNARDSAYIVVYSEGESYEVRKLVQDGYNEWVAKLPPLPASLRR